jgi:hypothetical protein
MLALIYLSSVTFVTYGLSGHPLNAAIIFSGLQYFNVLKQPISFLPMAFTAVSDAAVAVGELCSSPCLLCKLTLVVGRIGVMLRVGLCFPISRLV